MIEPHDQEITRIPVTLSSTAMPVCAHGSVLCLEHLMAVSIVRSDIGREGSSLLVAINKKLQTTVVYSSSQTGIVHSKTVI